VEVRSPNFSVVTDAGEKRGREVAMRFEQMRAVLGALMTKAKVNLPVPLQIVAFRNTKEMRQVAPLFNGKPTQVAGRRRPLPRCGRHWRSARATRTTFLVWLTFISQIGNRIRRLQSCNRSVSLITPILPLACRRHWSKRCNSGTWCSAGTEAPGAGMMLRHGNSEGETDPRSPTEPAEYPARVQTPDGPAKFIRGTLTKVDYSKFPLTILTVVSGAKTWKMSGADRNHLVLIGADQFSCEWQKQKVALNYRETSEGEGNVISLEIQ
jgi:hypothetical protein